VAMRRPGPEEWQKLIEEFRASGLQQKEFCAKHDVSLGTFQFWLYRKAKRSSGSESKSAPTFLPVEVVASPAPLARAGELIEVALRSGAVVRFSTGTDTRYIAELLAALG
jgi:hypothetical protein